MNTALCQAEDVARFRNVIERRLGLYFDEGKTDHLAEVLHDRLRQSDERSDRYLDRLENEACPEEWGALGQALTVPETYFFRHQEQFRAFIETVLPARARARASHRRLSVLSAGCASGEEAYTVAMLLRDAPAVTGWQIDITAVDINPAAIEKARRGRYSGWALRETETAMRRRWFRSAGRDYLLDESIREAVRFEQRNLASEDAQLWQPQRYDVVFCRNVLMYFAPERARALIARIARSLAPDGYLFLGHAETLRGLSQDFRLCHTHGTFYYQRRAFPGASVPHFEPAQSMPLPEPLAIPAEIGTEWMEAIQRASERINALAALPVSPRGRARATWDLSAAQDLLRQERYGEALAAIDALPSEAARDNDVLLLQAMLYTHAGRLADAERTCERLLACDELNAGARYIMALCREGAGDAAGAVELHQTAAYLDPGFAMPRLHLGLLARRAGDPQTARRELSQACALLQREEPARLLMYGGGFSREALLALCRAELKACGGEG